MSKVVVLGCGPAGLTATRAALDLGHDVTVVAAGLRPSQLYGCQYLHAPIPGYEELPNVEVGYSLIGTAEQYREKVYGSAWEGKVSPEDLVGTHHAWDIRETYKRLWDDIMPNVEKQNMVVQFGMVGRVRGLKPDKIISTIPAFNLCRKSGHQFRSHVIYANGSTVPDESLRNQVVCNGMPDTDWYRKSYVFGYSTTEWPLKNPINFGAKVTKPLTTNCDCNDDFIRAGRYGQWDKSVLVHQVYAQVQEALK